MSNSQKSLTNVLQYLNDSIKGLTVCAEDVNQESLKAYLSKVIVERKSFAEKLKGLVSAHGGEPTDNGSLAGPLHRIYVDLKAYLTDGKPETIKSEIIRGDKTLVEAYNEAIKEINEPNEKAILSEQLNLIHKELVNITNNAAF